MKAGLSLNNIINITFLLVLLIQTAYDHFRFNSTFTNQILLLSKTELMHYLVLSPEGEPPQMSGY